MRTNAVLFSFAMLVVWRPVVSAQPNPPGSPPPRHVEGELLVKFAGGPRGAMAEQARVRMQHEVKRHFDIIGWQQIRLPRGMTVEEGLVRYRNQPGVLTVEPNGLMAAIEPVASPVIFQPASESALAAPDDPMFPQQWGLAKIGAPSAWAATTGRTNVVVAVIDCGINYHHEDLRDNMWRNPGEIPANGIDDDANGFVDDVHGIDTADDPLGNDSDPFDEGIWVPGIGLYFHGTACSGVIGATGNNGRGLAGVNWSVRLMALRCLGTNNTVSIAEHVEALAYVVLMKQRGVNLRAVNMSFGTGFGFSQAQKDAMDAVAAQGIIQAAAVANFGGDNDVTPVYPASHPTSNLLAVAASDPSDNLAVFSNGSSNFGRTNVDLAAPGTMIPTCVGSNTNSYVPAFFGTSSAAPHVAGAAALLFSANPGATAEDVKAALLETVDVLPAFTNKMVSNGRLNVGRAIRHPAVSPDAPPFIAAQPQTRTANEGTNTSFIATVYGTRPLFYQWRRQGEALADGTNGSLTLSNLTAAHAGDYAVVVSNAFGVATSAVASLTVRTLPRLVGPLPPLQLSAVPGEMVTLSVETTGTLPIGYRWRYFRTNGTSANLTNFVLNQHTCFLTLTVDTNSAGAYTIILTNAAQPTSSVQRTNTVLTVLADSGANGLPDEWETTYPNATNPAADTDQDGLTNLQEYRAGTNPQDAQSYLRVMNIALAGGANAVSLRFLAAANKTYTVESRPAADAGAWTRLADVVATSSNRVVEVLDQSSPGTNAQRYYRLATPRVP